VPVRCGIDWAEDHHDVALVDEAGQVVASRRIGDDPEGARRRLGLLAEAGDAPGAPVPVAIETPRGFLVACLVDRRLSGRRRGDGGLTLCAHRGAGTRPGARVSGP
jgi:hypothetical protein